MVLNFLHIPVTALPRPVVGMVVARLRRAPDPVGELANDKIFSNIGEPARTGGVLPE